MKTLNNRTIMRISLVAIMFIFAIKVEAQKLVEFGVRYMPTLSNVQMKSSSGGTVEGKATLGYGVGVMFGVNFTKHFSLQSEIIYSSVSQKYSEQDVERTINLKYINIPLLVSLNTNKYGPVNLNIVAGPQLGLNVGSSVNTSNNDGTITSQAVLSVKSSDIGFAYGLGIDFGLNTTQTVRLGLGFRAVRGLIDISDNEVQTKDGDYYIVDNAKVKTNAGYIGLSILF